MISSLRARKTRRTYEIIGGSSPINNMTFLQSKALEQRLAEETATGSRDEIFKVFVGMRYWHPFVEDAVKDIHGQGIEKLIALSLYPHYSAATTGSSLSDLRRVMTGYPGIKIRAVESWHDHPLYIQALVENITKGLLAFRSSSPSSGVHQDEVHILFSAHSLPKKFVLEGDPYVDHIMATIQAVTAKINVPWSLSYQSKSGPVAWLEPSTEHILRELSEKGVKNLLVVPVSFVSDHIETLYEIDILYKTMAAGLGIRLERVESLNLSGTFISALCDIVLRETKEAVWRQ